jgi:hypothetical protein
MTSYSRAESGKVAAKDHSLSEILRGPNNS